MVTCELGDIPADDSVEVVIAVIPTDDRDFTNTVNVVSDVYDRDLGNNTDTLVTTVLPSADLGLTLSDQPDPVVAGEYLTYTLDVNNAGPSTASGVSLIDTMPGEVTFVSVDPPTCNHTGNTVSCNLGNLGSQGNKQVVILVQVSPSATGSLLDSASVTSTTYDPDPGNNYQTEATWVGTEADLAVSKVDGPDPLRAEETLVYTVTVSNIGPSQATNVLMTDTLPAEMVLQSVDPGQGSCNFANPVICNLDDLDVGSNWDVIIEAIPSIDGVFTNTASVVSYNYDPDLGNNAASATTLVTAVADLRLTKTDDPDPVYAGDLLTYTLTTYNDGPSLAEGVLLTDTLPGGVDFVSAPGCNQASGVVTCDLGDLDAGNNQIVEITVRVQSSWTDDLQNNAEVHAVTYDPDEGNNHDTEGTTVDTSADLAIDVLSNPPVLKPGEALTYTLSITNDGPSDAVAVSVVDTLPEGVTYQGSYPDICLAIGLEVTCSLGTMGAETDTQILIYVTVGSDVSGNILDTASVSASTGDPDPGNNTSEVETLVDGISPEVHWVKPVHDGQNYFTLGGVITLGATATDNDQIDRVLFMFWDELGGDWVLIGTSYNYPYEVPFDTDVLEPNTVYQLFVRAYDRAGNAFPYPGTAFIYIERVFTLRIFLPLVAK